MNDLLTKAAKGLKRKIINDMTDQKAKHAETVIRNHVLFSMGAGVIPVPIVDILAVGAMQLDMIRQLCKVYDVDFAETQGKAIVSSLTMATLARLGAGSLAKMIPVIGSLLGGVTNAAMAGASTYALGQVFRVHFENGGTVLDFDVERLKKMYKEQFEKGKKVADEMRQQQEAKREAAAADAEKTAQAAEAQAAEPVAAEDIVEAPETDDIIVRLKQLADLKEAGFITDFEFERMKKRVMKAMEN